MSRPAKVSTDELVASWVKSWEARKMRLDGKGFLVPFARPDELATKAADFDLKEKALDPKAKLFIGGMANAKEVDRMNEVLEPTGVIVGPFSKNPILLWMHNHQCPIGLVTMFRPEDNGVHFEAWIGDPAAGPMTADQERVRSLVAQRIVKAVSVGFIPHKIRMPAYNDMGDIVEPAKIEEWEMLELSPVSVPCNAGSLFDLKKQGQKPPPKKLLSLVSFPVLGKGGKFEITKPKEAKGMDEELKELLKKLGVSMDSVASGLNTLVEGQKSMQKTLDTLGAAGKGKKPGDDEEDDEDDEEMKKLRADLDETKAKVGKLEAEIADLTKTVEVLVTKATTAA